MPELHPQVQGFLKVAAEAGLPKLYELSPVDARLQAAGSNEFVPPGPEIATVKDLRVPVRDAEIPARLYEPAGAPATIVWLHGGGWVIGDLDSHDAMCRHLADVSGCRVVAIDYRLAPEHPFPTPLNDCWDALNWVAGQHGDQPLILGGDSAGGNMTAVCAVRARDAGGPELAMQLIIYPVTDADVDNVSYTTYGDVGLLLGRQEMVWFFDHYAPAGVDRSDPEISPLQYESLAGLPPTVVVHAEHDPLRDEGLAYAARLSEAGVPVSAHHFDDMLHGFFSFPGLLDGDSDVIGVVGREVKAAVAATAA